MLSLESCKIFHHVLTLTIYNMSETNLIVPFFWGLVFLLDSWKILEFAVLTKTHLHVDSSFFWNIGCPFNIQAWFFLSNIFGFHYYASKEHFLSFWSIASGRPIILMLDHLHPPSSFWSLYAVFFSLCFHYNNLNLKIFSVPAV